MAIDKLFEDNDCVGCGPAQAVLPPPTLNKQWFINDKGNWQIGDYDSGEPARGPKGDTGAGVMEYENTEW